MTRREVPARGGDMSPPYRGDEMEGEIATSLRSIHNSIVTLFLSATVRTCVRAFYLETAFLYAEIMI